MIRPGSVMTVRPPSWTSRRWPRNSSRRRGPGAAAPGAIGRSAAAGQRRCGRQRRRDLRCTLESRCDRRRRVLRLIGRRRGIRSAWHGAGRGAADSRTSRGNGGRPSGWRRGRCPSSRRCCRCTCGGRRCRRTCRRRCCRRSGGGSCGAPGRGGGVPGAPVRGGGARASGTWGRRGRRRCLCLRSWRRSWSRSCGRGRCRGGRWRLSGAARRSGSGDGAPF